MNNVDLKLYEKFVNAVTSAESNNYDHLNRRIEELRHSSNVNISLLMTGAFGLGSESGEFQEIVKKVLFQGKPLDEANIFHMKRELGDIIWYWANSCRALGFDPNDVIAENVTKLESRYPGGKFDVYKSENRQPGDL